MKTLVALNSGLKKRVMWLSKAIEVREEVVSYFKKHFEQITRERPWLDDIDFKQLSENEFGVLKWFLRKERRGRLYFIRIGIKVLFQMVLIFPSSKIFGVCSRRKL
jgi:hypothetical protein